MKKKTHIHFGNKNGHDLYLISDRELNDSLSRLPGDIIQTSTIICLGDIFSIVDDSKAKANPRQVLLPDSIQVSEDLKILSAIKKTASWLKANTCILVFPETENESIYIFVSCLLAILTKDSKAENCYQYLTGEAPGLSCKPQFDTFDEYLQKKLISGKAGKNKEPVISPQKMEKQSEKVVETKTKSVENQQKDEERKKMDKETQETPPENSSEFKPSKVTILVKLISIITMIILFSLSSIIVLATYFFKTDNEVRVKENNVKITEVIGMKVKSDIGSITEKSNLMGTTLKQEFKSKDQKSMFMNLFFENDKNFIFLGIFRQSGEGLEEMNSLYNKEFLKENQLAEKDFEGLTKLHGKNYLRSFDGAPVIYNASPGFKTPVLAVSMPYATEGGIKTILLVYMKLEKLLGAFQTSGIVKTMMINGEGSVVAHPDSQVVLSGTNLTDLPIVKAMMTSSLDNGQTRYKDTDGLYYLGTFKKLGFAGSGIISVVSEEKAFEEVYNIQRRNIYIMVIILNLALIIVYFFAKTLSNPILKLLGATKQIEAGDFQVTIRPTTRDEVGVLTNSFIEMGKGLEERQKVKSILGSMIDPVVVKEAMKDMAALKRGSEKVITAFFSDVAGFSTISEQLKSVELAALLNEYLSAMTIILKKHDGVLDKYIGDAIVGIFGAPVDLDAHYLCASKASIEMIAQLEDLRKYWTENNLYSKEAQEMDVRIGLNTGPAKVGFMGTDALASYTMMGDTVNLAARLEAAGKDYGVNILISEMVKDRVENEMFTRELDLVRVKGKNEPVKLYELIAAKTDIKDNIATSAELYEKGFKLYLTRDWDKAIECLKKAEEVKGKKDKAAHMLMDRCEAYKQSPPGKDWDGVYTRTHK